MTILDPNDYDWISLVTRPDPITGRKICFSCWNNDHSQDGCLIGGCECLCITLADERSHKVRKIPVSKKKKEAALSESPLAAVNPLIDAKINLETLIANKYNVDIAIVRKIGVGRLAHLDTVSRDKLLNNAIFSLTTKEK